jgi:phosphodiesterase/alkaline phosphatase D-like protein
MIQLDRRRFIQSTSLALAGGCASRLLGSDTIAPPQFAAQPSFEPTALFLTWQRDPTTTMTVQWIGAELDAENRPIYFAPAGSDAWRSQKHSVRPFPLTDKSLFRAELTGLAPGTEYRFRVGLDSAEQRFRTMPAKATDTIHFVSGGDSGRPTTSRRPSRPCSP